MYSIYKCWVFILFSFVSETNDLSKENICFAKTLRTRINVIILFLFFSLNNKECTTYAPFKLFI